jgi:hypothetical protein
MRLNTADTTAGTIPSSMKEGIKQIIIGSTLRTADSATPQLERSTYLTSRRRMVLQALHRRRA